MSPKKKEKADTKFIAKEYKLPQIAVRRCTKIGPFIRTHKHSCFPVDKV
jgi:hypothetical protein